MHLTPREQERLQMFTVAELARRRRARGRLLNAPEAIALICDEILEAAWDGLSLDEVIEVARRVLTTDDVRDGVAAIVSTVQVEALFPSGTSLVAVDHPIKAGGPAAQSGAEPPGAVRTGETPVEINVGRPRTTLTVRNTGDTVVYLSSHYPLHEVNRALDLDREAARGLRLDIAAGTALAFEPGEEREVVLVPASRKTQERA
ncbi:urease subunit gamma [Streptomyces sp. LHD-70]|uniref:urease subunit gamma n=1 Tax=Streptomyces sp. LHD-70 TaxID=3072140 RepID=UPI00280D19CB|nr:urease subunit gamma [Streptomyces sp. LHD-70]MDQ8702719.1 urease subunit gamma [Streptomyces sp. LHD-70]